MKKLTILLAVVLIALYSCSSKSKKAKDNIEHAKHLADSIRIADSIESAKRNQPSKEAMKGAGTFTDSRDGKTYKTVKIGTQTWFAENLAYKANSGCRAPEYNQSNVAIYGYLYDWKTAMAVCPAGWHLPTVDEWTILMNYLGGEFVAGGKLKYWDDLAGNNESGFTALLAGSFIDNQFELVGRNCYFWLATDFIDSRTAWYWVLSKGSVMSKKDHSFDDKSYSFSVRCIKDN